MNDWSQPQQLTDLDIAFPADVTTTLLPPMDAIPKDFEKRDYWLGIVARWFFQGLPEDVEFHAKSGINARDAFRHVAACLRSFQPQHEHKEAGCAYLLSQWFDRVEISSEGT